MADVLKQEFDYIIVGSGPGGASVARTLAMGDKKSKKNILILERGSNAPIKGSNIQTIRMLGMPFRSVLVTPDLAGVVRGIGTGGSSVFYYATAFDPPSFWLKKYGIDLSDEVRLLKRELPIAPLSDNLFGPMGKRIMQSAGELGYSWKKLNKFIYQDKCRTDCEKCTKGCPYGAKWNARYFIEDALQHNATLINHARVQKVIIEGGTAIGVEFRLRGKLLKAFGTTIILSAGGIGTPVILRNSGFKGAGYDYFYDPLVCAIGAINDIKSGREIPMQAGGHFEDDGLFLTDMCIPSALYRGMVAQVGRFDKITGHRRNLVILIKEKDEMGGYLSNRGGVRKRLTVDDKKILHHGFLKAKNILKNAGARNIVKTWYMAAHPGGTVKIAHLVDKNLSTEVENLYVCDASVIPEAPGSPPALTILALGMRLGKHLLHGKK